MTVAARVIPALGLLALLLASRAAAATEIVKITADPDVAVVQGYFREYALDNPRSGPAIVAVDEDDDVWVAMARSGKLVQFRNDQMQSYDIGQDSRPVALVLGTAKNGHPGVIWISAAFDEKIVRFDKATKAIRKYSLGTETMWPFMIGLGANGELWFSERAAGRIGRLDPDSGRVEHFDLHSPSAGPAGLAVDPASGIVWFTQGQTDRVGALDPKTGKVTDYIMGEESTGMVSGPAGLATDGKGEVWFSKLEGKIGHIRPGHDTIELIDVPETARRPAGIAIGPDGDVWSLALDGNMAVRYAPATRKFTLYPIPTGSPDVEADAPPRARTSRPFGIAFDRQGNLWFSEQYTGQLGVLALAPPQLALVWPQREVNQADPLVTLRAFDRVSGIDKIEFRLDGRAITLSNGRLPLFGEKPGRHRLEVTAVNRAGFAAVSAADFTFNPDASTIDALLGSLQPATPAGREALKAARASFATLPTAEGRLPALLAVLDGLAAQQAEFSGFPRGYVAALIDHFKATQAGQITVKIIDDAPYFAPANIRIHAGSTVTWRYDPPIQGHVMPLYRQRLEIVGEGVTSPPLRPGESFAHRFLHGGRFAVVNRERSDARITIEVVE